MFLQICFIFEKDPRSFQVARDTVAGDSSKRDRVVDPNPVGVPRVTHERNVMHHAGRRAAPSPRDIIEGGLGQLLELPGQLELRLARLGVAVELDAVAEVARDEPG